MNLFFELLRVSLGTQKVLTREPTETEWAEIYQTAEEQSVVGILFGGLGRLTAEQRPVQNLLLQWYGVVTQIEERNRQVNEAAQMAYQIFKNGGVQNCVLKGQGVATLYPQPLRRQSGDVDLWVKGSREATIQFLKEHHFGTGKVVIHHIDAYIIDDVLTEIHFIPVYTYNPFRHKKILHFLFEQADTQFCHYDKRVGYCHPTNRFNAVYLLSHLFMHFLYEGVGLRQIVDYYYLLKNLTEKEREDAGNDIRRAGLEDFAGAVMYVLHHGLGMDNNLLVCAPNDDRGKLLLNEIIRGGNFGKYDVRLSNERKRGYFHFQVMKLRRQWGFLRYYPADIISVPFWKIGHYIWRKWKGYI